MIMNDATMMMLHLWVKKQKRQKTLPKSDLECIGYLKFLLCMSTLDGDSSQFFGMSSSSIFHMEIGKVGPPQSAVVIYCVRYLCSVKVPNHLGDGSSYLGTYHGGINI
jgi:hypothetical protein